MYDLNVGKSQAFTRETLIGIIKNCPEVSPYWLITGEGSMLSGSAHHNAVATDNGKATVNHNEGSQGDVSQLIATNAQLVATNAKLTEALTSPARRR